MATSSVSGLASGIDWQSTITMLMQIAHQPVDLLELRKETYDNKLSAWSTISSKLSELKSMTESMDSLGEMLTKTATSSDTTVLSATANSGASTGSYSVLVNQLAQAAKITHDDGFADLNSTAVQTSGTGHFVYVYEGVSHSVDVAAGTTLNELVALINNDVNNPGIAATVLNDGGASNAYHLVLTGETGAAHTLTIDTTGTDLNNFTNAFTQTQNQQDAQIKVDGYPPDPTQWITSATNAVTGVITGVTLNLKSADPANTITVTVANDNSAVKAKIQSFVDAYNSTVGLINYKTSYDPETKVSGDLFGDASAIGIKGELQSIIASTIPGLLDNALYNSLSEIGVKSGSGGLLSIDSAKLDDALEENFDAVGEIFAFSSSSSSNNLSYFTKTTSTLGGIYNISASYDAAGNLLDTTTINGHPVEIEGGYIIGKDGYPEAGLRIAFTNPGGGPGTLNAEVRLATGSAVELFNKIDFLIDPYDGTVHYAQQGIEDTISNIDDQISSWDARLAITEEQYKKEFTAMETLISQMQSQGNYISAMMSQL
ncbi:MAG: flagellar filament capping protein FliD [bacterium]|nr:flagellar filament capping protein FliD [bacterium]